MSIHLMAALVLLFSIILGLIRILRGPTAADSMMAAQLFGTCGVAILLLLGKGLSLDAPRDIALVFSLLAALTVVAFVLRTWKGQK
ncbi:MAG: monovalent cation/H+ antiporter complex subunit F [Pseudomonadota bacterium]